MKNVRNAGTQDSAPSSTCLTYSFPHTAPISTRKPARKEVQKLSSAPERLVREAEYKATLLTPPFRPRTEPPETSELAALRRRIGPTLEASQGLQPASCFHLPTRVAELRRTCTLFL